LIKSKAVSIRGAVKVELYQQHSGKGVQREIADEELVSSKKSVVADRSDEQHFGRKIGDPQCSL
jgi:hypothetical protein